MSRQPEPTNHCAVCCNLKGQCPPCIRNAMEGRGLTGFRPKRQKKDPKNGQVPPPHD